MEGEQPLVKEEVGGVEPEHQVVDGGPLVDQRVQPVVEAAGLGRAGEVIASEPKAYAPGGEDLPDGAPGGLAEVGLPVDVEQADAHVEALHRGGRLARGEGEAALGPVEAAQQGLAKL